MLVREERKTGETVWARERKRPSFESLVNLSPSESKIYSKGLSPRESHSLAFSCFLSAFFTLGLKSILNILKKNPNINSSKDKQTKARFIAQLTFAVKVAFTEKKSNLL